MAAFILAVMMNDYRPGQVSVRLPPFLPYTLLRFVFVLFTFSIWNLAFHETFANKKSCTGTETSKHVLTKVKQYMYQRKQTCPWCWTVCGPKKQNAFADKASQLMQTSLVYTFGVDIYTFEAQIIHLRLHGTNYATIVTSMIWSSFFDVILVLSENENLNVWMINHSSFNWCTMTTHCTSWLHI